MIIAEDWLKIPEDKRRKLNEANVYYTEQYSHFEKLRGHSCIYAYDERGIITVVIWHKLVFKWGSFPSEPFYFQPDIDEQKFLDDVLSRLTKYCSWISKTEEGANFKAFPSKSLRIPFGNYIIDLTNDEETLFSNVTSKCRNMIRKAKKDGVEIICGGEEYLEDYLKVDSDTWERSGLKIDFKAIYQNYLHAFGDKARIFLAIKDGVTQGGAFFVYNQAMSYYLYGASIKRPSPGSMNLLQWEAMIEFKKQGVKTHSFVGCRINEDKDSKYHNIQKFKSSFGGELVQGYMFKSIFNPTAYKLFCFCLKIRHPKSPIQGDTIDQEIHKWHDLNNNISSDK